MQCASIHLYFLSYIGIILDRGGSDKVISRKGHWSEEEDRILAYTVIQYIQSGKTQLEAFKDVAQQMNRTPSACGYRWNANLRTNFQEELKQAKQNENANVPINQDVNGDKETHKEAKRPLQIALQYLEYLRDYNIHSLESIQEMSELKKENEQLKEKLAYFEKACSHAFSSTGED